MFDPKPKPLIPKIIKARVPVWLLVGALVAQYTISIAIEQKDPECTINVQRVHQSTYSLEYQRLSEAKIKISTLCTVAQEYTSLTVIFEEVLPNRGNKVVKTVKNIIARPRPQMENYVLIENLTVPCRGEGQGEYYGRAFGHVLLQDGHTVAVNGNSDKSNPLKCRISAK